MGCNESKTKEQQKNSTEAGQSANRERAVPRVIPATGCFTTQDAGPVLTTLLTQHVHVIECTVCAANSQPTDLYLCFDGGFENMILQLKEHYSAEADHRIDVVDRFVKKHALCGRGCQQHASRAIDCRECRAVPRPFEFHSVESTEEVQSATSTDNTLPLVEASNDDVPANVPSSHLEPIDALPSWLRRMGIQDVTSCEVPNGIGSNTVKCVVVNGASHPSLPGVKSLWFVNSWASFVVMTFEGLDPRRAVVPTSVMSAESIRYRDTNQLVRDPQLPERPSLQWREEYVPRTEDAVRAFMRTPEELLLRLVPFDEHQWHSIVTVHPPECACTTAHLSEHKRTVLCVCGESGIGKSKWVVDVLSQQLRAVPVVVNLGTITSESSAVSRRIDELSEKLRDASFAKQREVSERVMADLGRHAVTLELCSAFFPQPEYSERRDLALSAALNAFEQQLDELTNSWSACKSRRNTTGVVTNSNVLLVIDEVGANLNIARALLSDRYIQRTLKNRLFGSRSVCKTGDRKNPLRVDLVLCGTSSDALSSFYAFSTDPGSVRIVQLKSNAASAASFGNALMAQHLGGRTTVEQLPLAHWVDKIWTNPRLAHAFADHLGNTLANLRSNVTSNDIRHSADFAMAQYARMNGLASVSPATKLLLIDVAFHELSIASLAEGKYSAYNGHLRVNWSDPDHTLLFKSLTQPPPYSTAEEHFEKLRNAVTARPKEGVTALVSYDATGNRNLLYMAFCFRCVTLGLMTYSVKTDSFDASPALRFALCLRFGQIVNPSQGDAFEEVTLTAVQRGLEAQGYHALVVNLPFPMPDRCRTVTEYWHDGALQQAARHLKGSTQGEPRAVVIKNGPSAPAADIIVLKSQVFDPNESSRDAVLGPEFQMMLIGCKNNDLESQARGFERVARVAGVDPSERAKAFANNRQRAWRSKWCTLGVDATVSQEQTQFSCDPLRNAVDDISLVDDLTSRYSGGLAARTFFETFLFHTAPAAAPPAAPTAPAVPAAAPPATPGTESFRTEYVLQDSFLTKRYVTRFNVPSFRIDATQFSNAPVASNTFPWLHACALDDLGLFAALFEREQRDAVGVMVILLSSGTGAPICPPCEDSYAEGSRRAFMIGSPLDPPSPTCCLCTATLASGACKNRKATCHSFVWSSTSTCVKCHYIKKKGDDGVVK